MKVILSSRSEVYVCIINMPYSQNFSSETVDEKRTFHAWFMHLMVSNGNINDFIYFLPVKLKHLPNF